MHNTYKVLIVNADMQKTQLPIKFMICAHKSLNSPSYAIMYRDESLALIGMHNSCHSNCTLDTESDREC